jgi:hypothetical protein
MQDAAQLRQLATCMFATAMATKDQSLVESLCIRACEYLDQASALEAAQPSIPEDDEKKEQAASR